MINAIVGVLKYTGLVLTILVLSHIVQIKGVTISQHVENGMSWISGSRSRASITTRVTQQLSSAIRSTRSNTESEDADGISHSDKKELDSVIQKSAHRR